jgi:hypothetical protein
MSFSRTESGLVAKYHFYKEPLIWVEGRTDIPFYRQIIGNRPHRIEDAQGVGNCHVLADAMIKDDLPYVVVFDGHYGLLDRKRSPHRRVVTLDRYCTENYLFEKESSERVCQNYAQVDSSERLLDKDFDGLLKELESALLAVLILDVAHYRAGTGEKILPDGADPLFKDVSRLTLNNGFISNLDMNGRRKLTGHDIEEATNLVQQYLTQRRFIDLLRGRIAFGLLRHLIRRAVKKKLGRTPNIDNDGLRVLLVTEVWNIEPSRDHTNLKRRLKRAVSEVERLRA